MARIRTIKPEFFRHEKLQDLEIANPGSYAMLVFAGLWGHCDKAGRFEWKPRTLKLDILPFIPFDMDVTLCILAGAGLLRQYEIDGKTYGEISSFEKHQRIGGKEAQEPAKHPEPTGEKQGSNGEAIGKQQGLQEGKGREGKGTGREEEKEGNGVGAFAPPNASPDASPEKSPKAPKKASQLPTDFEINETGIRYATERGVSIESEFASFRNWHTAKGTTLKDWQAGWRTWCDKAVEFGRAGKGKGQQARLEKFDPTRYVNDPAYAAEIDGKTRNGGHDGRVIDATAQRLA